MPHATTPAQTQDEIDDDLIRRALNDETQFPAGENIHDRELELGEKADDAVDYADLSDDDLADDDLADDDVVAPHAPTAAPIINTATLAGNIQDLKSTADDENDPVQELDDLFGDGLSPVEEDAVDLPLPFAPANGQNADNIDAEFPFEEVVASQEHAVSPVPPTSHHGAEDESLTQEEKLQRELFAMSRSGLGNADLIPHPPENDEELLLSLWPKFQRDTVPKFMDLLPSKRVRYLGKAPPRQPKALHSNKLELEIAQDEEKSFVLSSGANKRTYEEMERMGIIPMKADATGQQASEAEAEGDSDFENDSVAGVSWHDMQILCGDWDVLSEGSSIGNHERAMEEDPFNGLDWPLSKRRKIDKGGALPFGPSLGLNSSGPKGSTASLKHPQSLQPGVLGNALEASATFHDPEAATARIANKFTIDLNDPYLLIDENAHTSKKRRTLGPREIGSKEQEDLSRRFTQKYNVSNDEAYDLLKENHQHKVRGTLGNVTIEHTLPAIRLQWPFYKTKLDKQEARSFHRPFLKAHRDAAVHVLKVPQHKRKEMRKQTLRELFGTSSKLTLADNSTCVLLEYSEEHPTMLSNLGMGNKIINYYRRQSTEDNTRPKSELGDLAVLLPQDKSPFSIFGHVDPGELTTTLHNGMYRAPIFAHKAKETDFLVIRSSTGEGGPTWFMRNVENVRVVGQEFPSVDIPGPHSRKVTTASKNRLKMISYRLLRKTKSHRINVGDVTKHFIDSTDMQNRQKMKEFMQFDKDYKEWKMRPGEPIPDEETVRSMVRPEDVCLLESMQVGQQHLVDAGFSKDDDNSEEDDAKEGTNIEQQLAPWFTSRNFMHATQGKAMLQLHGEGDPSGRGIAFSFIKTSMKGGFRAMGESVAEKIESKRNKEFGGHSYNVARQQQSYEESIRRIWEAQKQSLSTTMEHSDSDMEDEEMLESSQVHDESTPRSDAKALGNLRRFDDETTSQSTRFSNRSQAGKVLQITRQFRGPGGSRETQVEEIRNPRVIRQYLRQRHAREAEDTQLSELKPTGDDEADKRDRQRLEKELARLQRNKERRFAREKQKGIAHGSTENGTAESVDSPNSAGATSGAAAGGNKPVGTQRKCANCGQVGHIKTNKKVGAPDFHDIFRYLQNQGDASGYNFSSD